MLIMCLTDGVKHSLQGLLKPSTACYRGNCPPVWPSTTSEEQNIVVSEQLFQVLATEVKRVENK